MGAARLSAETRTGKLGGLCALALIPLIATIAYAQEATSDDAGLHVLLADIPALNIQYYRISGANAAEIRASMDRLRPTDANEGQPVDAVARWHIAYRWPIDAYGRCDLSKAVIDFRTEVVMPQLSNDPRHSDALRRQWQGYITGLGRHEANHIRNAYARLGEVRDAIRASTCETADTNAQHVVAKIAEGDIIYDRVTAHGVNEGLHFP